MTEIDITNGKKESRNDLVVKNNSSFLQSREWGEFQENLGRKMRRVSVEDTGKNFLCFQCQLPFKKNYLYCPRPVFNSRPEWDKWLEKTKTIAREKKAIFVRIDPELTEDNLKNLSIDECGFKKSFQEIQPKNTLILDLTKSESELLGEMKPKTRYNIKLARRKDLIIISNESPADKERYFDGFWQLIDDTAKRNKFRLHPKKYYQTQLTIPFTRLFLVGYQDKIIAGAVTVFFGERVTYLHGASSDDHKNLMAPYLLHWEIIKYAKNHSFKEYDFWGISDDSGSQNWGGITRFKKGFGGKEYHYAGAYDLPLIKEWYCAYRFGKKCASHFNIKKILS